MFQRASVLHNRVHRRSRLASTDLFHASFVNSKVHLGTQELRPWTFFIRWRTLFVCRAPFHNGRLMYYILKEINGGFLHPSSCHGGRIDVPMPNVSAEKKKCTNLITF